MKISSQKITGFGIPLCAYLGLSYLVPCPDVLSHKAWNLFAIFVGTIAALITKPLPIGSIAILSLTISTASGTISIQNALNGFASEVIWLILLICIIARSIIKVGLSDRIAYSFTKIFGKDKIGLSYSLILTDVLTAPFILSPTARAGGIMIPVYNAMASFVPDKEESKELKNFLSQVYVQTTCITAGMFLTATSANPLIHKIALAHGISITWLTWTFAASIPALICLISLPHLVGHYFAKNLASQINFKDLAKKKLDALGPLTTKEWIVIFTLLGMLLLWISGAKYGVSQVGAAFITLSILLLANVLTFEEILTEKEAWNTFLWFAVIIMLSDNLQSCGVIAYFSNILQTLIPRGNWYLGFFAITITYFYSHYFFAGAVPHVSSMYGILLSLAIGIGTPPLLAALVLAFTSSLFLALTHYAGASTALIFTDSSITVSKWWQIGFVVSAINLLIWSTIGVAWWKFLKLW